jgi:phage gp36-like protein
MIARFGELEMIQLTDRDNTTGVVNLAVLDAAIADAEAEVDSYISVRYAMPLASVPDIVKSMTADVARYRLYDTEVPEIVEKRYDAALRLLRDVAARRASLDKDINGNDAPVSNGVKISKPPRVFNDSSLDGY